MTVEATERNVTRRMFYGQATEPNPTEIRGLRISVRRSAEHKRSGCALRWSVYDATGPRRVTDKTLVDQPARDVLDDPGSCTAPAKVWVPLDARLEALGLELISVEIAFYSGNDHLGDAFTENVAIG